MVERRPDDHELPTPRSKLAARYVRSSGEVSLVRAHVHVDPQALIDAGKGDVPLVRL